MDDDKKRELVILEKELLIQQLYTNMAKARKEMKSMSYAIEEYRDSIEQWELEIEKQKEELSQLQGGDE